VNNKTVNVDEKRPLQGTSKHIANLSLLYRNKQSGTNAQISYVFTGSRLERLSPFYGQDYYTKDYNTLDFSADQKINKHILIFTKMTNLLNNPYQIQIKNSLLVERDLFGRFFYLGIRYKFN
jgi:outer membrane receptor protein involved in Fe transport